MNDAERIQSRVDRIGEAADSIRISLDEAGEAIPPVLSFVTSDGRYEIKVKRQKTVQAETEI